jgi:uncharacterized protein YndB with AHSA1/START domain
MAKQVEKPDTKFREVLVTRVFDAPRELVWKAWTDPKMIMKWWGPKGFTSPAARIDFRVGGSYLFCMRTPDGQELWSKGIYKEIIPMEKIVATDQFSDKDGNTISASVYGLPGDWPEYLLVTITFEDLKGRTRITLRHSGLPAGELEGQTVVGWNESLDKLAAIL